MHRNTKRWLAIAGLATGGTLGYLAWANRRLFLTNDVTTGESPFYPELLSRVYYAEATDAIAACTESVRSLDRWRVIHVDRENDVVEAEAETAVGKFLDDVTIYAQSIGGGQCRVTVRSRSRSGGGDLGQNAVHIRELQEAMDVRLTRTAAL
jgi:uncharacterized protein (DUF1499 family)